MSNPTSPTDQPTAISGRHFPGANRPGIGNPARHAGLIYVSYDHGLSQDLGPTAVKYGDIVALCRLASVA